MTVPTKRGAKGKAERREEVGVPVGSPLKLWPRANHLGDVHPIVDGAKSGAKRGRMIRRKARKRTFSAT